MRSVVDYEERGTGGKSSYRGNCSPKLILDLHDQFKFQSISDYMCGSSTTGDAAMQLGIKDCHMYDLNRGFDLVSMDIPERNEFIFNHLPYWDIIQYSSYQYSSQEVKAKYGIDSDAADLSHIERWDDFVKMMNYVVMKQYASLEKGGRIAILMGDIRKKGKYYSMLAEIAKPGTLESIVIKTQHNCVSDRRTYSGSSFIPIAHEYLMICRKDSNLIVPVMVTEKHEMDVRDLLPASWKDIVYSVMKELRGPCSLEEIYSKIDGHRKAQTNRNWQAKVRQTLQMYPQFFRHEGRGVWAVAA